MESASNAIAISNGQGHHFYQNKAFSDLFGYLNAEETEASGGGRAAIKDPAIAKEMFGDILSGKPWSGELEMLTKSGRVFPAYERADAILDSDLNIMGMIGIITDLTTRKQAEDVLRKSEQMLQTVLDHFPGVIFWKDRQSIYLGCNQAFAVGAGLKSPAEIVGKIDLDLTWGATEAEKYRTDDLKVMKSGKSKFHIIEMQHQANGKVIWLDTSKIPVKDFQGQVVGVIGISNDIFKLKKAEQELSIAYKDLLFQYEEKEKRANELIIANKKLLIQDEEKEKRAAEMNISNMELQKTNSELDRFVYSTSRFEIPFKIIIRSVRYDYR